MFHCNMQQHAATHCNTIGQLSPGIVRLRVWMSHITNIMSRHTYEGVASCHTYEGVMSHHAYEGVASRQKHEEVTSHQTYKGLTSGRSMSHFTICHCKRLLELFSPRVCSVSDVIMQHAATPCNTPTHCDTLQHTATHCNTLQICSVGDVIMQHAATHWNTLQHARPAFSGAHPTTSINETCHTF